MSKTIVINLMGGPGSGKSTTAAGLFYKLKKQNYNVELAFEFAKDKVWEESFHMMENQIYIFGKQYHRIWRLKDKVDFIITDSPLLVSLFYNKEKSETFDSFVIEQFNKFNNIVYFIERNKENYQKEGRMQTKEEAEAIDEELISVMNKYNINFKRIPQENAVDSILNELTQK